VNEQASKLLAHPGISTRIAELRSKIEQKTEITIQRIAEELARVAFADQRKVMRWGQHGVTLHDSDDLSDDAAAIVSEVSETTTKDGGSIKLKSHDKVRALELLGKHMGMFKEKLEVTTPGSAQQEAKIPADAVEASKTYKDLMG